MRCLANLGPGLAIRVASIAVWALSGGCAGRPARVEPPPIDAAEAGRRAIALYDQNNDDALSGEELAAVPSLKKALPRLDTNPSDEKITANEIQALIARWQERRHAMLPVNCHVTLDGRPLPGAVVTLEPEPYLGDAIQPATGTTNRLGNTGLSVAEQFRPDPTLLGVHCGLYKVRISKQTNGQETLPAKYHENTILGAEVSMQASELATGTLEFHLKSS